MWRMRYHEELRFEHYHRAVWYRDSNGLAWSHFIQWDGVRGWRIYPHKDRMNAWQRSHYKG